MMFGRVNCPRCAELIKRDAEFCHFCGCKQPAHEPSFRQKAISTFGRPLVGLAALAGMAWFGYELVQGLPTSTPTATAPISPPPLMADSKPIQPQYEPLALGATLEWEADIAPDELVRQAGVFVIRITKKSEDELVAPVINISDGSQSVTLEGAMASPGYTHKVSLYANRAGAVPVVMLQSFTGGAHCCNVVKLAGYSGGNLKAIELGTWDGDNIDLPADRSGDGIADFVVSDNAFLYAFSSYASSYGPPQVLNVVGGRVLDVSSRPEFRELNAEVMSRTGAKCISGTTGDERNGACPAYVATAARVGLLDEAWSKMISSYDARAATFLPNGCSIETNEACPADQQITYKSYPEALLGFLKDNGYITRTWVPPEIRGISDTSDDNAEEAEDSTTY